MPEHIDSPRIDHTKTKPMKTTYILLLTCLATLSLLALSACSSSDSGSGGGTHQMGAPKTGYTMPDRNMPGRN